MPDPNAPEPLCIVPIKMPDAPAPDVFAPAGAAGAPMPHLDYNGGPLLGNVQVFTLFWGDAWQSPPLSDLATQLNGFFQFILSSTLIDQLSEYSTSSVIIGHGTLAGSLTLTTPAPSAVVDDSAIQSLLQDQAANNPSFPPAGPNLLFFVFLPSGIVSQLSGAQSCAQYCGYHSAIGSSVFYAVMPYPDCDGCLQGLSAFDSLTVSASHELCEAITDPIPGQGWYWFADQNNQGEIGDICAFQTKTVGAYTVQQEWSNQANGCV